ncbi:MAG: glycosyltransferase, partial [Thermoplasmata archaeon]
DSEYVLLMDADNSIKLSEIIRDLPLIDGYDVLLFNRYSKEADIPFMRWFFSRSFNLLIRALLRIDLRDTQTGYKVFRDEVFKSAIKRGSISNAFYDVAMLYYIKKSGGKIREAKTHYMYDRGSKFHPVVLAFTFGISLIAFIIRNSPFYHIVPEWAKKVYYKKFKCI